MAHIHGGKSSSMFLPSARIIRVLELKGNETVLDAGCGTGHLSIEAAKHAKKVYAFDIHADSINELKSKKIANVDARMADINKLPLKDEAVDAVILSNVLHGFVENMEQNAIQELIRVLVPGGKLLVVEFKENALFGPPKAIRLTKERVMEIFNEFRKGKSMDLLFHYAICMTKPQKSI